MKKERNFDFDALFDEYGIKFKSSEQADSFTAIGYDNETVVFEKADFSDTAENVCVEKCKKGE